MFKKPLPGSGLLAFTMFYFNSSIVFALTFMSLIYFVFIFMLRVKLYARCMSAHVNAGVDKLTQHFLLKTLLFPIEFSFLLCQK